MDTNRRNSLGSKLRYAREKQGLSLETLADMSGVSFAYIWRIEQGRVSAGIDILCKLADALGIKVYDLIDF